MADSILLSNSILVAAEKKIEDGLTPQNKSDYLKVVVAGMHAGMAGGPKSILASLKNSHDPVTDCAKGAINLCLLLRRQSRGTMPLKAMIPAAYTLMLHALDFAAKAGMVTINNGVVVQATHYFTNHIFSVLKITPQMLQTASTNLHKITSDPAKMELINRKAGVVKSPMASEPTPVGG